MILLTALFYSASVMFGLKDWCTSSTQVKDLTRGLFLQYNVVLEHYKQQLVGVPELLSQL